MLRDVFYYGNKPNVHPREKFAKDLADAKKQSTTEHFWIINEFCDYTDFDWDFDFDFLSDDLVWTGDHNNVWPSKYQKDSGTWLCNKRHSDIIVYRNDVESLKRKPTKTSNWVVKGKIDESKFDFAWHPDPTDPPFIYQFPSQWNKTGGPRYHVDGATEVKYVTSQVAFRLADKRHWKLDNNCDAENFDYSWHPDDTDPPFIYQFGTQWQKTGGPQYIVPGATKVKYEGSIAATRLVNMDNWTIPDHIDVTNFDFSWHPDDSDPLYIYEFGTQWQKTGGPVYNTPGATEKKYVDYQKAKALPQPKKFRVQNNYKIKDFDYSWHPDATEEAYVYVFGNQHYPAEKMPTITYRVIGAREEKFINEIHATLDADKTRWLIPNDIDDTGFDYSWVPDPGDPSYVYLFGTQHQKTGGPKYVPDGIVVLPNGKALGEYKYIETQRVKKLPDPSKFEVSKNIDVENFDFSWHPDETDLPYIYEFATQWQDNGGPRYIVPGATQVKYIDSIKAKRLPSKENWTIPKNIDVSNFDFSWHPDATSPPFIYQFGTQWQKTGGPCYNVPNATEKKYIDVVKAKALPQPKKFRVQNNYKIKDFDYSWHPDETEEPFVYTFGNQYYSAEKMPTLVYRVIGAREEKFINDIHATLDQDKTNWIIPDDIDDSNFDYSWVPDPGDPSYAYEFGTQHQKTGGPVYAKPGVKVLANGKVLAEIKYIDTQKVKKLPNPNKFKVLVNYKIKDFDYSWHPDNTESGYTYVFGNQHYSAEKMPTLSYGEGFKDNIKYVENVVAILDQDKTNWIIPKNINDNQFDYSWVPDPGDPLFVYQFGTQWQKTGGPKYIPAGIVVLPNGKALGEYKYMDFQKVTKLPEPEKFVVPSYCSGQGFDFSWHPDETELPYIYEFGTQWQNNGGIRYILEGATSVKYVESQKCIRLPNRQNWNVPDNIDIAGFDFSWHPDATNPPFIYQFGTQHQKTGGPSYVVEGATGKQFVDIQKVKALPQPKKFRIENDYKIKDFDYSWHPDDTEDPYVYVFGNQHHSAEKMPTIIYRVLDARENKYIDHIKATLEEDKTNWQIPDYIDESSFDFSWMPDPGEPKDYIYEFPTVWHDKGGPRYITPGIVILANGKPLGTFKYMEGPKAKVKTNTKHWIIPNDVDVTDFDFSWIPHPDDPAYIYQFGTQWQKTGGPQYVPAGTPLLPNGKPIGEVKYLDTQHVKKLPSRDKFTVLEGFHIEDFDYSWHPDETETGFTYVFGNQHYGAEKMPTIKYGNGFKDNYKYVNSIVAKIKPSKKNWEVPDYIDETGFDFSWIPDPDSPPYIYEFATVWNNRGGPKYIIPGATDYKYMEDIKAKCKPSLENWVIPNSVDRTTWDFSWRPHPDNPPYTYEFATVWNDRGGPKYVVPGSKEFKYVEDIKAKLLPSKQNWQIPDYIDSASFDFSWRPHPEAPPYIYEFATVWNNRGGPKYIVPGAKEYSYIENIRAKCKPSKDNWEIPTGIDVGDFDFSWRPHPEAPAYIYQFGTLKDDNDGPRYVTPGHNNEIVNLPRVYVEVVEVLENTKDDRLYVPRYYIETTLEALVNQHPDEIFWALRSNINYDNFNFDWRPIVVHVAYESDYVHVFGSPDSEITQTYFVNANAYLSGKKDFKFIEDKNLNEEYLSNLFVRPDIFLVDRGNPETQERYNYLKSKFTNVQKTRFFNNWVDTINRCINRSNTELCWILNSELDYSGFDFNYYPNPWQMNMVHIFGTQWSHWGSTFIVNKNSFPEDTKYIKVIEHLKNLNFVKDRRAKATNNLYDVYVIDHGNIEIDVTVAKIKSKINGKNIKIIPYDKSYLNTLKNIVKDIAPKKEHYIWVTSSICDYSEFSFDYICDPFAKDNLHVFPSGSQKFGDTFLLDVNKTKELIDDMQILQQYHKINYTGVRTKRLPAPVINSEKDTHVGCLNVEFDFPYAIFQTEKVDAIEDEPMCLWSDDTKNILVTSTGATRIVVPKEAKDLIKKEFYDYPYIKTASRLVDSKPLDIVFLSNGEKSAEENYEHLLAVTKGLKNRVVRVDGVNGRVAAYHAAVLSSNTPWAFTVFAKLKVNSKFDFSWQPDRMQSPKHYIFHAKNPVNGLEYGHQGMIAYNKKLTLANTGKGLDFTLDDPHETIELLSGTAEFNTDSYSTWRTAFREVIKLKADFADISQERLKIWISKAKGKFAEDCLQGAKDAVEYYEEVSGDIDQLKLSYEWNWLKDYYNRKYK